MFWRHMKGRKHMGQFTQPVGSSKAGELPVGGKQDVCIGR